MAKVYEKGKELEGRFTTTEAQGKARELWDAHISDKQAQVLARQAARLVRSPKEQLQLLDKRLGVGQGATKERAHLWTIIARQTVSSAK